MKPLLPLFTVMLLVTSQITSCGPHPSPENSSSELHILTQNFPLSSAQVARVTFGPHRASSKIILCVNYSSNESNEKDTPTPHVFCTEPYRDQEGVPITLEDIDFSPFSSSKEDLSKEMERFLAALPPHTLSRNKRLDNALSSALGGLGLTVTFSKALRSSSAFNKAFPKGSTKTLILFIALFMGIDFLFEMGLEQEQKVQGSKVEHRYLIPSLIDSSKSSLEWDPLSLEDATSTPQHLQNFLSEEFVKTPLVYDMPGIIQQLGIFLQVNNAVKNDKKITHFCFPGYLSTFFDRNFIPEQTFSSEYLESSRLMCSDLFGKLRRVNGGRIKKIVEDSHI